MNYLIGIKNNKHIVGNTGTLITRYKAKYKLKELANNFAKMYRHDEVYLIYPYTQKMCEMNHEQFIDYIRKTGERLI